MSTIVMSGCATGIGAATRKALEAAGHTVIGVDIRDAEVIADLSTAEGRKQAIADVLAMRPSLILLDEPTASLDAAGLKALQASLARFHAQGMAVMISTHDLDLTWRWADRILVFHEGELVADDTPELIFNDEDLLERVELGLQIAPPVYLQHRAIGRSRAVEGEQPSRRVVTSPSARSTPSCCDSVGWWMSSSSSSSLTDFSPVLS